MQIRSPKLEVKVSPRDLDDHVRGTLRVGRVVEGCEVVSRKRPRDIASFYSVRSVLGILNDHDEVCAGPR